VTGLIVEDETRAVGAIVHAAHMPRDMIRRRFKQRFTARRMAQDYLALYRLVARGRPLRAVG
jgi:hypothetical protein